MSFRILIYRVAGIDSLIRDPCGILNSAEGGITAVFIDNAPVFYVMITPERLAQFLNLEARFARPESDVMLNMHLFKDARRSSWRPDRKFFDV